MQDKNCKISIVGMGIKAISHLTLESNLIIQSADVVFHSNTDKAISEYLSSFNKREINLSHLYVEGAERQSVYQQICNQVVSEAQYGKHCVYMTSGNPFFLNSVAVNLINACISKGIELNIYPGISSIDTIINDLRLPIGQSGMQCYEATHFVRLKPTIDIRVPLILFQPAVVETFEVVKTNNVSQNGISILKKCLLEYYNAGQKWKMVASSGSRGNSSTIYEGSIEDMEKYSHLFSFGTMIINPFLPT